tara:strand:+ start:50 stop:364 length:315 start_codon:yes stop_codon:yes gene_type:complete
MKYLKQMIADFLRKLIKLDDYIEDRVFTDIERLEREIEIVNELTDANGLDLNERPTFYDMEVQIDDMVNNSMAECAEQMVEDNMANVLDRLDKLENFFGRKEDK